MFLVQDVESSLFIFTVYDPRDDGFKGTVEADVTLHDSVNFVWPEGGQCPEPVIGVSPSNHKEYRAFNHATECRAAGFRVVSTSYTSGFLSYAAFVHDRHKTDVTPGKTREWLRRYWNAHGQRLIENGGFEAATPSLKRRLMREYIDGEPVSNMQVNKLWRPLKDQEKTIHLLDAFPDEDDVG